MKSEDYKNQKKYKLGAMKRKLGIKKDEELKPGDMISKLQKKKVNLAVRGLI